MCGIAGFFGKFDAPLLSAMGQSIAHRGPDGFGEILLEVPSATIGLAHRRLSIIDLSEAGKQPMALNCACCGLDIRTSPENNIWITFNGEIYNFPELKAELLKKGHSFQNKTDTEVILHLYAEEGISALKRLNGIFALAIYDGRDKGQKDGIKKSDLILIRDGLGVKPLYYAETKEGILFASEIKALLQAKELDREVDNVALRMSLSYLYIPAPYTAMKHVRKLPPGNLLIVRNRKIINQQKYYQIPYTGNTFSRSGDELKNELAQILDRTIKRQLISDVPVGAFLSGGLDSSGVVAQMVKARPGESFRCFTIGDGNSAPDERNDLYYAKSVAQKLDLDLSVVNVRPANFELLQKVIFHLDEPQADPSAINVLLICEQARQEGIKVLMSGAGGDDIFSGYPRHFAVQTEALWSYAPAVLKRFTAGRVRAWLDSKGGAAFIQNETLRKVSKVLSTLDYSQDERLASFFMNSDSNSILPLLGERFSDENKKASLISPLMNSLSEIPAERDTLNRMLYLETMHFLADHNLNYVDKMSMASGVEVRVPLIDLEMVNFVAQIPSTLKRRNFESKYIFKQAIRGLLPPAVYTRKKQGFGLPVRQWLKRELAEVVDHTLNIKSVRERGFFNPHAVERLVEKNRTSKIDATFPILAMMCIELWARAFIDQGGKSHSSSLRKVG